MPLSMDRHQETDSDQRRLRSGWTRFWRQIGSLPHNPIFFVLTMVGNGIVVTCALLFYGTEKGINPMVNGFGDALWWAFATITTVGYGDTVPHTVWGRLIAVFLMLTGGALFLSFTALLSNAFREPEYLALERDVRELRSCLEKLLRERVEKD